MKLGIMQPYFFPYVGHFELIQKTDRWVVFDSVQYNARTWMNRNRILHPTKGEQYVGIPVEHAPKGTAIGQIRLADKEQAKTRILGQLAHYRRHAPYFDSVTQLVRDAFAQSATDRLVDVNVAAMAAVCRHLGLRFDWQLSSELDIDPAAIARPGAWALAISQNLGANRYVNPPGGRSLFRQEDWQAAGIELRFTELQPLRYPCGPYAFVDHLSILDVLMWLPPDAVRSELESRETIE